MAWQCSALGVSRSGFHAWLNWPPSQHALAEEKMVPQVRSIFLVSDRTYGARRVWHDVLAAGFRCGLHKIERLMRAQALGDGPVGVVCEKTTPNGIRRLYRPTFSIGSSRPPARTRNGWPISPMFGRTRAGSMSRWSSPCFRAVLSAGR